MSTNITMGGGGGGGGGELSVVSIMNKECGNQQGCALVFSLFIHFFFDLDSNMGP